MTPRLFTGLAVAAAGSLVLAALVHASADSWVTGTATGAKLFPSFKSDVARTQSVTLKQGAQSIVLERTGEAWSVKDRGGFPVQGSKVGQLLAKLEAAELVGAKTRNPERFALLELEDPNAKDAKSRYLSIADDKGRTIAEVIVGKRSTEQFGAGKGGTYVRRPGANETWLVNAEIDVNPAVNQWADTTIFESEIATVARVTSEAPDQPKLVVEREAGKPANKDGYKLAGMPDDKKLKYDYALEDIVNAFARVEFEDVRKAPADVSAPLSVAVFEADNGLKISVRVKSEGDARWATIEATAPAIETKAVEAKPAAEAKPEPAAADAKPDGTKPPDANKDEAKKDEVKPAEAKPDPKIAAKTAADKINARVAGWQFRLPSWKYDQLFKKQADLLDAKG